MPQADRSTRRRRQDPTARLAELVPPLLPIPQPATTQPATHPPTDQAPAASPTQSNAAPSHPTHLPATSPTPRPEPAVPQADRSTRRPRQDPTARLAELVPPLLPIQRPATAQPATHPPAHQPAVARPTETSPRPDTAPGLPTHLPATEPTPRPRHTARRIRQSHEPIDADETNRLLKKLADTHHLEIIGFESSGLDADSLHEIATALDDLMTKYPIALRGFEIADLSAGGTPSRIARPDTAEAGESAALWIVLDRDATIRVAADTDGVHRGWRVRDRKPMYAAVVREFGRALDLVSDGRAHPAAQRALVTERLRSRERRLWSRRDRFDPGLLDLGQALADGFTEFELYGKRAGALAAQLHDLLISMALNPPAAHRGGPAEMDERGAAAAPDAPGGV
ncbi:hypothetical protein [Nocardia sp. NPDC050710]|uniref:hypothetical protein n=1 Tax=Nocardia sp. NPDC050710 TaxID=3157220 RepID=UPI0033C80864